MKTLTYFFSLIAIMLSTSYLAHSQTIRTNFRTTDKNIDIEDRVEKWYVFLFDDFREATVYIGEESKTYMLNYKLTVDVFAVREENGGTQMLSRDLKIDSIVVDNRVFIYHPTFGYLEKLGSNDDPFFIKYQTTYMMEEIKQGGYGDALASASVQSVNILEGESQGLGPQGSYLVLENTSNNPVRIHLTSGPLYGKILGGKFKTIQSRRDLNQLYPDLTSDIRSFLRSEEIAFDRRNDLIKLTNFLISTR